MNNSFFGKSMENVRLQRRIDLVQLPAKVRKFAAQPSYKSLKVFKEELVAVERFKTIQILNKPIFIGLSILELSNVLMYDFHYNYIKHKYPKGSSKLLFTDTLIRLFYQY